MALAAYGWKLTVSATPLVPPLSRAPGNRRDRPAPCPAIADLAPDREVGLESYVEPHPLDAINRAFEAVRRRDIARRAVLVP